MPKVVYVLLPVLLINWALIRLNTWMQTKIQFKVLCIGIIHQQRVQECTLPLKTLEELIISEIKLKIGKMKTFFQKKNSAIWSLVSLNLYLMCQTPQVFMEHFLRNGIQELQKELCSAKLTSVQPDISR